MIIIAIFLFLISFTASTPSPNDHEAYIVYVKIPKSVDYIHVEELYLEKYMKNASSRLLCTYKEAFDGFAANLTVKEAEDLSKKEHIVRVQKYTNLIPYTTYSPAFLGLQESVGSWEASNLGSGMIIAVLDGGIIPTHPSFSDEGMPPPPTTWRGVCEFKAGCNNKIIGARNLIENGEPNDDADGHGIHTASTAAGTFVMNVSIDGLGAGTAAGVAPRAHLAIYKVCTSSDCPDYLLLRAIDMALQDGVDVISISIGLPPPTEFSIENNPIAIGAMRAIKKGVSVVCAAGNIGPAPETVRNAFPWVLTVAAGSMDRSFLATVKLGDGQEFEGESLDQIKNLTNPFPLFYSIQDEVSPSNNLSGKIRLCDYNNNVTTKVLQMKNAGGAGVIPSNTDINGYTLHLYSLSMPACYVSYIAGCNIRYYATSALNPSASIIFKGTQFNRTAAPAVASFSSRGPSLMSPGILKPDVMGPGVNIIAAGPDDGFIQMSGTSMSTPHLSGVVVLLKSIHPEWTPAAIKSAIMTTSDITDMNGKPIMDEQHKKASFLAMGAGHVNPNKAMDPGLIYDIEYDDYLKYLCGLGYGDMLYQVVRENISCSSLGKISMLDLNYPAIVVIGESNVKITRTVTNVGEANSIFTAELKINSNDVSIQVDPKVLEFHHQNQKLSFTVSVTVNNGGHGAEGYLQWVSKKYNVRSPIVVV